MTACTNKTSNNPFINLDANASEPVRPEARLAAIEALSLEGNPASPHRAGRRARALLDASRERIASLFGADPERLVFTSGGTEANALALHATGRVVLAGATEHDSVRSTLAADCRILPVAADGQLRLEALDRALAETTAGGAQAQVCLMLANNETGVLHPLRDAARLCRAHRAWLHVDAVQAAGRMAIDLDELGADSLAVSAHKLGGPKGAGALLLHGARRSVAAMIAGGGQERGQRGGTPALPAIAGFAAAAEASCADQASRATRDAAWVAGLEAAAVGAGAVVCGAQAPRLANTSCLLLPGRRSEAQLIALDLAGFGVSAGSACSSGKLSRSHVLEAMGFGSGAGEAIRVSLPWNAQAGAVEGFTRAYLDMVQRAAPRAPPSALELVP